MLRSWLVVSVVLLVFLLLVGCVAATPTAPPTKLLNPGNAGIALHPTKTATITLNPSAIASTRIPQPSPTPTSTPAPLPTIEPEFWATVGAAPDTLIALQTGGPAHAVGDIAVMSIDGTYYQQLTTYGYNRDPRLSPDRQRIAYRSVPVSVVSSPDRNKRLKEGNYNVWIITIDGTQTWKLTDSEQQRSIPDWSPDGRKVLFSEGTEGALIEIEVDTQARREIARGAYLPRYRPGGGIGYLSSDGGLAWIDESLMVHTLVTGETLQDKTRISNFIWSQDGQHVIYALLDERGDVMYPLKSSVWVIDMNGNSPTQLVAPARIVYDDLPLSTDNRFVAVRAHGYGDACAPGAIAQFLMLSPEFGSAQTLRLETFTGLQSNPIGYLFPISDPEWIADQWVIGQFQVTCTDGSLFGWYLLNPMEQRLIQITRD